MEIFYVVAVVALAVLALEATDALTVTSGEEVLTGWEALKQIEALIKTSGVQKAYDTGTQDPLIMPED